MSADIEVCICLGITLEEITKAIENGACSVEEIEEKLGAGSACNLCLSVENDPNGEREIHIENILKEMKQKGYCK
jgi:bacterioferritin-associated ferredoxin